MKKVLKKFNRTLSIMLAAAMVLTMVPQTAMPVLAAEVQEDEASTVSLETPADDVDSEETTAPESEGEGSGESGSEGEGSGESDANVGETIADPSGEQNSEEGGEQSGDVQDDEDGSVEEQPAENEEGSDETEEEPVENPDDAIVDPTITDPETPEDPADIIIGGGSAINAVTPSDAIISFESKGEGENETGTATIKYVGGCVDSANKLATEKNLRFRVIVNNGQALDAMEAVIGEGDSAKKQTITVDKVDLDKIYEVKWTDIATKDADGKWVANSVKITATTKAVTYTVKFTTENVEIYSVTLKDPDDAAKGKQLDTKIESSGVAGAKFSEPVEYALVAAEGYKFEGKITANKKDVTPAPEKTSLNKKGDADDAEETECYTFSLKPEDYVEAGDTKVAVNVEAAAKATLNIVLDEGNVGGTVGASVKNTAADKFIGYDTTNGFSKITEGDEALTAKDLAFTVEPEANYGTPTVTAKLSAEGEKPEDGTVVNVTPSAQAAEDHEYTIDLDQVKDFASNSTLTIFVKADYDSESENVHKIKFEGNGIENLKTFQVGGKDVPASNEVIVTGNTAALKIEPKDGYVLAKGKSDGDNDGKAVVTVKETRKYVADDGKYTITGKENEAVEKAVGDSDGSVSLTLFDGTGDKNYEGGDAQDAKEKGYTVSEVTVTITTDFAENTEEKSLRVNNGLVDDGASYVVKYQEKGKTGLTDAKLDETIEETENNQKVIENTWYIPAEAEYVELTVTSEVPPAVTLGTEDIDAKADGNVYTYIIPAVNMAPESTIAINKAEVAGEPADVKVKVDDRDVTLTAYTVGEESKGTTINGEPDEEGYRALAQATVRKSLSMTFAQVPGATLKSVSYTMGGEQGDPVEVDAKTGTATLEIEEVTGEVKVDVEAESAYVVKLYESNGTTPLDKDESKNVFQADYMTENIIVKLERTKNHEAIEFYDVVVEDGDGVTAETAAEIESDGVSAKIASIHESERGHTLTIKVYEKKNDTPYEAKLETNASSTSVNVERIVKGKAVKVAKDEEVVIPLDADMTFNVTSEGASVSDLGVKLFKEDGTALTAAEQAWFESNGNITIEDGTFTIHTTASKDARGKVEVRIYNKNEPVDTGATEAALDGAGTFKLNVNGYMVNNDVKSVTAAAGVAGNTTVRVNLNTTFVDTKNLPEDPNTGDLYYKVVLDEITVTGDLPAAGVTKLTGAGLTKYYKLAKGDYANPAKTVAIALLEDTRAADQKEDIAATLSTNIKEVKLVQSVVGDNLETKENVTEADYVEGLTADIKDKDKALTTKAPKYETKLTVKTVNGATVFTGQHNVKVATPVFGSETGYDGITVQFVDSKTGVVNGSAGTSKNNPARSQSGGFVAWVDAQDNSIYVSATEGSTKAADYKTLGVKVTADYPKKDETGIGDGYAASAVVKLKVQQGIYSIEADETKAKLPEKIYFDGTKNASVKITPMYNNGDSTKKPAKSAVTWTIDPKDQTPTIQKALVGEKGKPFISVKNGTVSVTKDFKKVMSRDDAENTVTVTATPADFARGDEDSDDSEEFTFIISNEQDKLETGSLVIVNEGGFTLDASDLKAENFDQTLYVAALKNGVKKNQAHYNYRNDFMPVTVKTGSKTNLEVGTPDSYNRVKLTFKKPGQNLKLNVNTVDGGKATAGVKVKDTLVVNIAPYENLGLFIVGADNSSYGPEDNETITYDGGSNQMYTLYLQHRQMNGDEWGDWEDDAFYKNVKVKVDGGKLIANKYWAKNINAEKEYDPTSVYGTAVVVTSKDGKAKITITDTANPDSSKNSKIYNIENTSFQEASAKAPAIKLVSPKKITNDALYNPVSRRYTNPIVYQVKDTKVDYSGQYVKVTPDYTAANNMAEELDKDTYGDTDGVITVAKIDENGYFEMCPGRYLSGGTYKMIATVGEMKRGAFYPLAKDVKLNFSIPKAKSPSKNLNVTAKYTLDAQGSASTKIIVKPDYSYTVSEAMNVIKDAKVQGTTKDTHTNKFTKYFEVKEVKDDNGYVDYYTIGLKDDLTAADIDYITGNTEDKELKKKAQEDCVGYINVSNWCNSKDVKVTISFKANKYTVTGASVFAPKNNTPVTVNVSLMSGKNPVSVVAAGLDSEDGGTFAQSAQAVEVDENGVIAITSKPTADAVKHDVKLKVVPAGSGLIKTAEWNPATKKYDLQILNKEGTTALSEADLIQQYGIPVTAKIDVKAVDAKKVINIKNLNVALSAGDYEPAATGTGMGNYVAYVPYTYVAGNTEIAAQNGVVLAKDAKSGKDVNETAELAAGMKLVEVTNDPIHEVETADGKVTVVPSLKVSISKAALEDQYAKAEANKTAAAADKKTVVTNYAGKLSVPVTLTYTNNGSTTETVTLKLTMPKRPASFDEITKILKGETKINNNKTDVKAVIENLKTPQADKSTHILNGLLGKLYWTVNSYIPQDSDVVLTPVWDELGLDDISTVTKKELNDGEEVKEEDLASPADYDDIMDAGTAVVTMTLTNKAAAAGQTATASLTYTFDEKDLGVRHSVMSDGNSVADKVLALIQEIVDDTKNGLTYNNATTEKSLLDEIKAHDKIKDYMSDRGSISIWIEGFDNKPATERRAGKIQGKIYVSGAQGNVPINKTLEKINNIGDVNEVLEAKLNAAAVLQIVDDCSGIKEKIHDKILADAVKAVANENISVAYDTVKKDGEDAEDFNYKAPTADAVGTIGFTLVLKSKTTDRTVKYTLADQDIPVAKASLYFDTADKAVAAIEKLVVTSDNDNAYNELKKILLNVENTQESVEAAIKTALAAAVVDTNILGWKTDGLNVSYTPAEPNAGETKKPGKVSFTVNLVLKGDESVKGELKVENAEVVDWKDEFQTADQLRAAIQVAINIEVENESGLPADANGAQTQIKGKVDALVTGKGLSIDYNNFSDPAAFTAKTDTTPATYANVKITIKSGDEKVGDDLTLTFTFSVKATEPAQG